MVVGMSGAVGRRPLVEVLFFDGCPPYQPLLTRLRRLLQHSHLEAELVVHEVTTEERATAKRFLGSPTVRVNGVDIDPQVLARRDEYGLVCRLYQTDRGLVGAPPEEWIAAALQDARSATTHDANFH
jgi:hypothetical protein